MSLGPLFVRLLATILATIALYSQADSPRQRFSLDENWKFHLGDDWPEALRWDKAGISDGPASETFSDDAWRLLNLPHDWAIELPFDPNADKSHGYKPVGPGFPTNSIGWYRRTFDLSRADSDRRIWLDFDGVFRDATVWVNGWLVGRHESGYYPFRYDITDIVKFGGKNTIAVRVDATQFEGWFYEGAGIYRHVWLEKTAPVAIAPDGIFVWSEFKNNMPSNRAKINVAARLSNALTNVCQAVVRCTIIAPDGSTVADFQKKVKVDGVFSKSLQLEATISSPILWSPEEPKLYQLITRVEINGRVVDEEKTAFGIRTVAFDPNQGFLLNGRPYELKGTCNHQDMAGVGVALPDALQYFRVAKLKEFGCNAYRTSHNPPTPELLEACDRLGMIVMDENRLLGSDAQNMERWESQIRRDRNHPSVCIWSIANEEFSVQTTPQAAHVTRTMQYFAKQLDPTRPVTYAAPQGDDFNGINSAIQVRGWNYHPGRDMDKYHDEHPEQPNVGTEQASTVSTRGIYINDAVRGYVSAYDDNAPPWAQTAETWWSYFAVRPWLSGGFVWTGFDYRGEPTPYSWPCINSYFGILDTCGFPKDNYYYYCAWWTTNIVLHLLPHWNWPGREGQAIRVDVLSNCKEVELFLNGQSLGRKTMLPYSKLSWQVKYAPGTLSAKGYEANGRVIAETKVETTGPAVTLRLAPDRTVIDADGKDAIVFTVSALDAQGRTVPIASNLIHFDLSGAGKILGVGNGDPSCHEPDAYVPQLPVRRLLLDKWRWEPIRVAVKGAMVPEYAPDFDDSGWKTISPIDDETLLIGKPNIIFRQQVTVTTNDLCGWAQIYFGRIYDDYWIYVNGQPAGKLSNWEGSTSAFDIKDKLHAGDNVIAVGVHNASGSSRFVPGARLEFIGQPSVVAWSRSLFNGLAQVIVQSSHRRGEIKLMASSDGLAPATAVIQSK